MAERIVWLDRLGDGITPSGVQEIESEADFLRHATGAGSLLVHGESLCDWAEAFAEGRGIAIQIVRSPTRAIEHVVPNISEDQARELVDRLGDERGITQHREFSPRRLLTAIYPDGPWDDGPSLKHAADWLLWLYRERPSSAARAAFAPLVDGWQLKSNVAESQLYTATDYETARDRLHEWLWIRESPIASEWGEFPASVPTELQRDARQQWSAQIIESDGGFFEALWQHAVPRLLLQLAAEETADFLTQHPHHITAARLLLLDPYLDPARRRNLRQLVPPAEPRPMPEAVPDILIWFEREYLPYRMWQSERNDDAADAAVQAAAEQFAHWYLHNYAQALVEGPLKAHLSFRQPLPFHADEMTSTLVIILDGLQADDAKVLGQELSDTARNLDLLEAKWVFAPLPTVTEFAKPTLYTGLMPMHAGSYPRLAETIPEKENPAKRLSKAKKGQLYFWSVMDPDETYHKEGFKDSLRIEVEAALGKIAALIGDVVRKVPREVPLRIVVTTDHGRFIGRAARKVPVPEQMHSHGRAAWGTRQHEFDADGVIIDGDVAFLHGPRFGLPDYAGEAAVILGPDMFKTNDSKAGSEAFPHGGVWPEEVIVPWWVLERDWSPPSISVTVTGRGVAGTMGELTITAMNPADISVTITQLQLRRPNQAITIIDIGLEIGPRSKASQTVELDPWPTPIEADDLVAEAILRLRAGKRFNVAAEIDLISEELYKRDDILGDLL